MMTASLVLEYPAGEPTLFPDENDGVRGFGIMTNEPPIAFHLAAIQHLQWKRGLLRQAVPVPGSWYPEDRYMRTWMVKSTMPPPQSLQQALSQAVGALNTITVPMGAPPGTDSGKGSGEKGDSDHSLFGVVRDHGNRVLYWRSAINPSLQRLRLADLRLGEGEPVKTLSVRSGPWFVDAASRLS